MVSKACLMRGLPSLVRINRRICIKDRLTFVNLSFMHIRYLKLFTPLRTVPSGADASRIDAKVKEAIEKRLWRKEYMTYKEQMDQEFNRGLEQGETNIVYSWLFEQGRDADVKRATTDAEFMETIVKEC